MDIPMDGTLFRDAVLVFGRPLIDRYNYAIKALSYASTFSLSEDQGQQLHAILSDLEAAIDDQQLRHVAWSLFGVTTFPPSDSLSEDYLRTYDLFVLGHFSQAADAAESLLLKNPTSFDVYWLLAAYLPANQRWPRTVLMASHCQARFSVLLVTLPVIG